MRATTLLKEQRTRIERLIDRLARERSGDNVVLPQLVEELMAHVAMEESVFYPAVRGVVDVSLRVQRETHRSVKALLSRLATFGIAPDEFASTVRQLAETVRRHFEADEASLFPAVTRALLPGALDELGVEMLRFRRTLLGSAARADAALI